MNKFETNCCPLCGKILTLRKIAGVAVFQCPTSSSHHTTHYEVEMDTSNCIQHLYLGDWSIDNFLNNTRSRVYYRESNRWHLFKEVNHIRADIEDRLAERLHQIMQ